MLEWLLVIGIPLNLDRSSSNIWDTSESSLSWQSSDFFFRWQSHWMSSIFFHAVVRVSELKCLRCLLFHAPMTVNAYSNPIKPVGGLKMFDYFYLAWIVYKCKLQCKRSLYTNTVIKTNNFFCLFVSFLKVTIKHNTILIWPLLGH